MDKVKVWPINVGAGFQRDEVALFVVLGNKSEVRFILELSVHTFMELQCRSWGGGAGFQEVSERKGAKEPYWA